MESIAISHLMLLRRKMAGEIKKILYVLIYFIAYLIASLITKPTPLLISPEYRVNVKYELIFLADEGNVMPVLSDTEGADVFAARQCGTCFITNNKGFLPITEYDAFLLLGKRSLLAEYDALVDPEKRYLIEASDKCIKNKLRGCMREPKITSFTTRRSYSLCSLCSELLEAKRATTLNPSNMGSLNSPVVDSASETY